MRLLLSISFSLLLWPAFGQIYLSVKTPLSKTKEVFYPGDWFSFKLKNDDYLYQGMITSLDVENNSILVETARINLEDIEIVYSQKDFKDRYSGKLLTAGILLPIIDHFNNSVIMDNDFSWDRGVMIASGALIASGLAIKLLRRRKYRIRNRFRLKFGI